VLSEDGAAVASKIERGTERRGIGVIGQKSHDSQTQSDDQSTDEGSVDVGSNASSLTSPNTPSEPLRWSQCQQWKASDLHNRLLEGFPDDEMLASAHLPSGLLAESFTSPHTWASKGSGDRGQPMPSVGHTSSLFSTDAHQMPSLGSGASLLSTCDRKQPSSASRPPFLSTAPPTQAALLRTPAPPARAAGPVLGTSPLGHGASMCAVASGLRSLPMPMRVSAAGLEELAPPRPNAAPLKVAFVDFECEVVTLDPRFPAKKRPPAW